MLSKYTLLWLSLLLCKLSAFTQALAPPVVMLKVSRYVNIPVIPSIKLPPLAKPNTGLLGTTGTECACKIGCNPLPLTLLSFEGSRLDIAHVLLRWKTTNEINSKGFDVERSLGNALLFAPISFVPSQGNDSREKKYDLRDNNDFDGISYYRLKQIDIDGRFTFSPIVAVKGYGTRPTLALYPNPVTDHLLAAIYFPKKVTAKLMVLDAAQQLMWVQNIVAIKGTNQVKIPAGSLAAGLYFIKIISSDDVVLMGKFIKQ